VPAWAYLDVIGNDVFNPVAAQADTGAPESSAGGSQPTGTMTSSTAAASPAYTSTAFDSSSTTPSPASGNTAPAKKSNVGAIAGGAVGGVVVLGLIAGLVAFLAVRKRRASKSVSSPADGYMNSPPPTSQQSMYSSPTYKSNIDNPAYGEHAALRVYDPSDPSTYPQSPPTPTIHTTNSGPVPHPYGPQAQLTHYSGIPEL